MSQRIGLGMGWIAYFMALWALCMGPSASHVRELEQRLQHLESAANSRRACAQGIAVMGTDGKSSIMVCQ